MNEKGEGKYNTVLEIFEAMEYGKNFDKVDDALQWLKSKENSIFAYVEKSTEAPNGISTKLINYTNNTTVCTIYRAEVDTVKKVLLKCNEKTKWIETPAFERAKMLNKLGDEISENADMFAQIEAVLRGILTKDTKVKAIPLLAQYFHYYSSFAVKYNQENPKWKPEGIAVGIVSDENSLSNVGLFLAPALAAGYDIVLQANTKIVPALILLLDLAKKVGIPEDSIRLIPSNDELLPYLNSEKVAILTLLVNLQNKKYQGINILNKKILNFASYKTPVIVFDSADLDSACESIVESAWGYQSLLPWSANTVLVQENIFATFVNKLKRKIRSLKVGQPHDKMVDISNRSESNFCKLSSIIVLAQLQGIEVFQTVENSDTWSPTLLIGGMVETNKVFSAGDQESNAVTVLAFRSIDEAVNLANNTRQGLAANVCSNNLGIINEVARKLKVGNIWINSSYGLSAADVTLCPMKDSGVGYFGGKEGFYEYVQIEKCKPDNLVINSTKELSKITSLNASTISTAKKAQDGWYRISKIEKAKLLQKFAEYVQNNKKILSVNLNENCLENWISTIYDCITDSNRHSYNCAHSGYNLTCFREPKGVIVIETKTNFNPCQVKLIIMSLFEGNSLIILNDASAVQSFYKEFSQRLPSGVLNVVPYNLVGVEMAAAHADINVYIGDNINRVFGLLPIKHSKVFSNVTNDWDDIYRKVTVAKNIWCDVGKSSTCNFGSY